MSFGILNVIDYFCSHLTSPHLTSPHNHSDNKVAKQIWAKKGLFCHMLEPPLPTKFDRKTMATNIQGLTELGVRFLVSKHVSDTLPNYKTIRSIIIAVAKR